MRAAALTLGTIFLLTWASPDAARAEAFVEYYGGAALTEDADITVKIGPAAGVPQGTARGPIEFNAGVSIGLRGGYWLESVPWVGLALDMHYYDPDEDSSGPSVGLNTGYISGLLMLRYPLLKGSDYPKGRLQPYAGVGPGAFITDAHVNLTSLGAPKDFKDTNVDVGVIVVAGVKFHVFSFEKPGGEDVPGAPSVAIFVEYGFTHFKPSDFGDTVGGVPFELAIDRLDTHHAVAGVSVHFW